MLRNREAIHMKLAIVLDKGLEAATQWLLPLGIVAVWEALSVAGFIPSRVLPAPTDVLAAGWKVLKNGELLRNIGVSSWRAGVGLKVAIAAARAVRLEQKKN